MAGLLAFAFPLEGGLHARPAAALRDRAQALGGRWTLVNDRTGRSAPLDSVLELLATDTRHGDPCRILGEEAPAAQADLGAYLAGPFRDLDRGEARLGQGGGPGTVVPGLLEALGATWWAGVGLAPGTGAGLAVVLGEKPEEAQAPAGDPRQELAALRQALAGLGRRLEREAEAAAHPEHRGILEAHRALLEDPGWRAALEKGVEGGGLSARGAVGEACSAAARRLEGAGQARLRERAQDLWDLGDRLLDELGGGPRDLPALEGPAVLVARSLPPSRLLALDRRFLRGLALGDGGATSHTAILARSFGIPCVGGLAGLEEGLEPGRRVRVDGGRGLVILDPPGPVEAYYAREEPADDGAAQDGAAGEGAAGEGAAPAGAFTVRANLLVPPEGDLARRAGAEGVGLFRTEMLFMDRREPPSEEEQAQAYAGVLEALGGEPLVLRLLDAGGDKPLPYLSLPREANPFLGRRGVRLYGTHRELILSQIRAALRAAAGGDLRLLVPMVAELEEWREVRAMVAEAAASLAARGVPFRAPVPLGVMVEVPAAALGARALAREADFLCVGTNDLVQYLFAADRGDPGVAKASQCHHPATLRLLKEVWEAGAQAGRPVSLCGEMASRRELLPLLAGLGYRELSVPPSQVDGIRRAAASLDLEACRSLARRALEAGTAGEVGALLGAGSAAGEARPLVEPGLVVLDEACATKEEAIRLLVERMVRAGRAEDPLALEEAVWARERACATAVGHGFAVPHCRSGAASGSLALLRLREPLAWGGPEGEPVDLVVLLAMGTGEGGGEHLRVFARLARKLVDPAFRAALRGAPDVSRILALLREQVLAS